MNCCSIESNRIRTDRGSQQTHKRNSARPGPARPGTERSRAIDGRIARWVSNAGTVVRRVEVHRELRELAKRLGVPPPAPPTVFAERHPSRRRRRRRVEDARRVVTRAPARAPPRSVPAGSAAFHSAATRALHTSEGPLVDTTRPLAASYRCVGYTLASRSGMVARSDSAATLGANRARAADGGAGPGGAGPAPPGRVALPGRNSPAPSRSASRRTQATSASPAARTARLAFSSARQSCCRRRFIASTTSARQLTSDPGVQRAKVPGHDPAVHVEHRRRVLGGERRRHVGAVGERGEVRPRPVRPPVRS